MRKWLPVLFIPLVFFLIGCEKYRCELEKEIYPAIHILGEGEEIKIIMEYKLGPITVVDQLQDVDEIDAFFLVEKKDIIESSPIKLRIRLGSMKLSKDGTYYHINSKEYRGEDCPSIQTLYNHRDILPIKWTIFNEVEYENGAPRDVVLGIEENKNEKQSDEKQETAPKSEPTKRKRL